jgi:hypothetical protein
MALRHLSFGLLHNEDHDCGPYLAQVALIVAIPYEAATARRPLASSSYRISLSCAANRDQYLLGDFRKYTSMVLVKWLSETCREGRMSTDLSFAAASTIAPDYLVIDLTGRPDSPVQTRTTIPSIQTELTARNPQRTNLQPISPTQLSRADGAFVGRSVSV